MFMFPVMPVRGYQTDLLTGKTEICNSGSWRIPSFAAQAKIAQELGIDKENIFFCLPG